MNEYIKKMNEKYPFISYGEYGDEEYFGIVQNCTNLFVNMYVYNNIPTKEMKERFLKLGEVWWWESNRCIPIDLFLKDSFRMYRPYLKTFNRKEWNHVCGPQTSLDDMVQKRIKRRSIQLIRTDI